MGVPLFLEIQADLFSKTARDWFWSDEIIPVPEVIFEITKEGMITLIARDLWRGHGANDL